MRWKIAHFTFCDQQQTLSTDSESQQLEPMMVELLSYFCQHPKQIIDKDRLIEQVWLGRIVSDNAVSRLITKLRKVLADDVRKPQFIATFPKKGYKFIADVSLLPDSSNEANIGQQHVIPTEQTITIDDSQSSGSKVAVRSQQKSYRTFAIALILITLVILGYWLSQPKENISDKTSLLGQARALTRDAGNEYFPRLSPDASRLAYMQEKYGKMHLMVKNLANGQVVEIKHSDDLGVGPASWSDDGTKLAYLAASQDICRYYIVSVNGLEFGPPQLIHNCPAGSFGKILFTHDNNRLVYAETEGRNTPYSLYEINLQTQKKKRLAQPELNLAGNNQFDLHPRENKLLISSPDKQQWEGFYSLDLDSDKLTLLFKLDAYICCGIWSHDGERVVLMGEHPAYQLLSYDLTGKNVQVLYLGSRQISSPERDVNQHDYLFVAKQTNTDIGVVNLGTFDTTNVIDSLADDRLATYSAVNKQIAYVSATTGNEEVWLADLDNGQAVKLSNFKDSRHYIDLQWSPNGKFLMALTLNEIHLIDGTSGAFQRLKIPQSEIRAVSFKDDQTLAYSVKYQQMWRVHYYHIASEQVTKADDKWQYIQYADKPEDMLWQDNNHQLYVGEQQDLLSDDLLAKQSLVSGRRFNLRKRGQHWFWLENRPDFKIYRYNYKNGDSEHLPVNNISHFDVHNKVLVYEQVMHSNADIYQTVSLQAQR